MDSGLFVQVLTSAEVIAAALFLILLLPLVFFIASTRSRRKFVRVPARARMVKPARPSVEQPKPAEQEEDLDAPRASGPRSGGSGPAGPEDLK